jgi:hypothetical protein
MLCEDYRKELTEAAAGGSALSRESRAHVEACTSCRAFFEEERQLFAGIDSGVRFTANAEVPASLLPRTRANLREQQVPRRSWLPVSAVFAAALMLIIVIFIRGQRRASVAPNPLVSTAADDPAPTESASVAAPSVHSGKMVRSSKTMTRQQGITRGAMASTNVAVLVAPGQKEATDLLLIALRTGAVNGDVLVAERIEKPSQDVEIAPLAISPIEIEPLAPVSEETAPGNEKTRR